MQYRAIIYYIYNVHSSLLLSVSIIVYRSVNLFVKCYMLHTSDLIDIARNHDLVILFLNQKLAYEITIVALNVLSITYNFI